MNEVGGLHERRVRQRLLPASLGLPFVACGSGGQAELVGQVVKDSAFDLFRVTLGMVLLFAAAGLVFAVAAFFLLRKLGGYRWDWRHAKWFRGATCAAMVLAMPFLFATLGFYEGLYRGGEAAIARGRAAAEIYPVVGEAGADAVAAVYVLAGEIRADDGDLSSIRYPAGELESYREGAWALDVDELSTRLARLDSAVLDRLVRPIHQDLEQRYPQLSDGVGRQALVWSTDQINDWLSEAVREHDDEDLEVRRTSGYLLDALSREAGSSRAFDHPRLASSMTKVCVFDPLVGGLRLFARSQQIGVGVFAVLLLAVPVVLFRCAHFVTRRLELRRARATAVQRSLPPPPPPPG